MPDNDELNDQDCESSDVQNELHYAGFWKRLFASILDLVIFGPLVLFILRLSRDWETQGQIAYAVVNTVFFICLNLFLLVRFGGTPGKLALGLKVVRVSGERITIANALLRNSSEIASSLIRLFVFLSVVNKIDYDYVHSIRGKELASYWKEIFPAWSYTVRSLFNWYDLSEAFVMLTNKKKQAIHDFLAGTVVIYRPHVNRERRFKLYKAISSRSSHEEVPAP